MNKRTQVQWRRATRWLRRARRAARVLSKRPDFQRPPSVHVEPPDEPSPRRLAERARLRAEYPLTSGADSLGLATSWAHRTVIKEDRPGRDDYPSTVKLPKFCLMMALELHLPDDGDTWPSLEALHAVYGRLGMPSVQARWDADPDATFADLRVAGPNPMFLRRHALPHELAAEGLADEGLAALPAKPLYAVAYDSLFRGVSGVSAADRRFFAPGIAVFDLHEGRLRPLGIQLRKADDQPAWFPADGTPAWRLAMMHFNSCDMLAHELLAHFLWTHVVAEKVLLATNRNLTWRHPLRRLLAPHLASTLNNNNNATPVLIRRGGLFDRVFGAGERGKLVGLTRGETRWDFDQMVPRRHIEARGLLDLPHYPYRDAAFRLWDAVDTMVGEYVGAWYSSDECLLRDDEAQAWGVELTAFMGPSVPNLDTRESLQLMLSAAIFNVLQHGFVNLLQYDALGYPPAYPVNVRVDVPEDPSAVTEATLLAALPTVYESLTAIRATCGFSIQYGRLGAHLDHFHSGESAKIMARFAASLAAIAAEAPPDYPPANPKRVGNSVDA